MENKKLTKQLANTLKTLAANTDTLKVEKLLNEDGELTTQYNILIVNAVIKLTTQPYTVNELLKAFKFQTCNFTQRAQGLTTKELNKCLLTAINIISFNPQIFNI